MRPKEYLVLGMLALVWGASFLFIRVAVHEIRPFALVTLRLGIATLTLAPVVAMHRKSLAGWQRFIPGLLLVGLFNAAIPYALFAFGEVLIPSGQASIINATTPLFAVALTAAIPGIVHERLTLARGFGALLSFGGVLALVGPSAFQGAGELLAYVACLAAALFYAIGGVIARVMLKDAPVLLIAIGVDLAGFLFVLPVAILTNSLPTHWPSLAVIASVVTLSTLGTGVAFLLFYWLLAQVGVTRTAIVTYLLPCTAIVWGAVLLGEMITPNMLIGLALVLLGIAFINNVFALRRNRQTTPVAAPALREEE
jgi:drug/metabolite transporter (DMT)-like permease